MSEDKDAKYPGQGGMGEAYAKLNKKDVKEANVSCTWNVRDLIMSISAKDREIAIQKRETARLQAECTELIERLRRIMQ